MDSILVTESKSKNKVFKDKALGVGTFIGGPLVAGYFFAENFKAINEPEKVTKTWVITILATIAIFSIAFMIPLDSKFPNQLIPIIYTGVAYALFKNFQEKKIQEKIESGAEYHSWGRVIGVSILSLLITVAVMAIGIFTMIEIEESQLTTKQYGLTVKHEIEYNSSDFTETEINRIADGFIEHAFFDLDTAKYVYAEKESNSYILYIGISELYANDPETLDEFKSLRDKMNNYITEKTVIIKLVVDALDNVVKIID
ncbi:hypothetical protein [uncultured Dokdonia sp.]|uniref:hypothetical protein n=1 Tax=uncultured Dokdonia sp. TaxID=575653 RepID=UPI00261287FD|nr:hypothetical protein [uncultured Dokdonia sp.]